MKTSSIIDRAFQLADLENSDFISWKEQLMMVNEAWESLYQKLIDRGDYSFLKTVVTTGTKFILPDDFYQLESIKEKDEFIDDYEIVGNVINIGHTTNRPTIIIRYWPKPAYLTFPNRDTKYRLETADPDNRNVKYLGKDFLISYNRNNKSWYIEKADGTETVFTGPGATDFEIAWSDGNDVLYTEAKNNTKYIVFESPTAWHLETRKSSDPAKLLGISSQGLKYFENKVEDANGNVIADKLEDLTFWDNLWSGSNYSSDIYSTYLYDVLLDTTTVSGIKNSNESVFAIEENWNSGYGFVNGKTNTIHSFFVDTELDFPKNVYFTLLAYEIAILMKTKQNGNTESLVKLRDEKLSTFSDTLTRDSFMSYRIRNIR